MSRKQYQQRLSGTTKVRFKLYKSGKLWLVSGLTTVSLLTGLTLVGTMPVHAATVPADEAASESSSQSAAPSNSAVLTSGDPAPSTLSNKDSDSSNTGVNGPATNATNQNGNTSLDSDKDNAANSNNSNSNDSGLNDGRSNGDNSKDANSHDGSSSEANDTSISSNPTAPSKSDSQSDNPKVSGSQNKDNTDLNLDEKYSTDDSILRNSDTPNISASLLSDVKEVQNTSQPFVAEDLLLDADTSSATTTDPTPTTTTSPVAPALNYTPNIGNFRVTVDGATSYALYGATASVTVQPYSTTNYDGTSPIRTVTGDQQLWGFYIILPNGVTANLSDFQESAKQFCTGLNADGNISNLTSLDVYRLASTNDGREVFYFRPNDGAVIASQSKPDGTKLHLLITTPSASSGIKSVTINADMVKSFDSNATSPNTAMTSLSTADRLNLAVQNDILFYGQSDTSLTDSFHYAALPWKDFSSDPDNPYPDNYLVGTIGYATATIPKGKTHYVLTNWSSTLTYVNVQAKDTYNVINKDDLDKNTSFTISGDTGTSYSPLAEISKNTGYTTTGYHFSLDPDTFSALPTIAVYNPTIADLKSSDDPTTFIATGQSYTVYVSALKTALATKPSTLVAGSANRWDPNSNLTKALDENSGTISVGNGLTMTTADGTPVTTSNPRSLVDTTKAGTYTVYYAYTDDQGNQTVVPATITILPNHSSISVSPTSKSPASAATTWDPATNLTSYTDTKPDGTAADPVTDAAALAQALADGTIKVTYAYQKTAADPASASNGVNPQVPGIYSVTYTYTDTNGQAVTATSIVTITAATPSGTTTPDTTPTTTEPTTVPGKTTPTISKPAKVTPAIIDVQPPICRTVKPGYVIVKTISTKEHFKKTAATTGYRYRQGGDTARGRGQAPSTGFSSESNGYGMSNANNRGTANAATSLTLPQTSDAHQSWTSLVGLGLLAFLGLFGFRRKQD